MRPERFCQWLHFARRKSAGKVAGLALLIAVTIVCVWAPTGCVREPEPPLRVGTFPWPGFEPVILARSMGLYDERSVRIVEFPSSGETLLAFKNRAIDAATVSCDDVVRLAEIGLEPRVILLTDESNGADVMVARNEFPDFESLRGMKVGVEMNTLGAYVLMRALELHGLSPTDVQPISMRIDRLEQEIYRKTLDAEVSYEPYRTRLLANGTHQIFSSKEMPGELGNMLVVRKEVIQSSSHSLQSLVNGWLAGLEFLKAHPEDAARRVAPREGVSPEQFLKSLEGVVLLDREANRRLLGTKDSPFVTRLGRIADYMVSHKMLDRVPEISQLRDDQFVRPAAR